MRGVKEVILNLPKSEGAEEIVGEFSLHLGGPPRRIEDLL
jgi:hypothetical protein